MFFLYKDKNQKFSFFNHFSFSMSDEKGGIVVKRARVEDKEGVIIQRARLHKQAGRIAVYLNGASQEIMVDMPNFCTNLQLKLSVLIRKFGVMRQCFSGTVIVDDRYSVEEFSYIFRLLEPEIMLTIVLSGDFTADEMCRFLDCIRTNDNVKIDILSFMHKIKVNYLAFSHINVSAFRFSGCEVDCSIMRLPKLRSVFYNAYVTSRVRKTYELMRIICAGLNNDKLDTWTRFLVKGIYDPRLFLTIVELANGFYEFYHSF